MSPLPKVLLVEDDRSIAGALAFALKSTFDVDVAIRGKLALYKSDSATYDVVVLDLNLPDLSGLSICQQLRERGVSAPILILSGESKILTKINLLDAGANDYLTKPFSLGEFKARLRALTRPQPTPVWPNGQLEACGLVLDRRNFSVRRKGRLIDLRPKEFALLECLMEHAGAVVTREELIFALWQGQEEPWNNTLDVHIKYLRDKLDRPFSDRLIQTVHGRGYKLAPAKTSLSVEAVKDYA